MGCRRPVEVPRRRGGGAGRRAARRRIATQAWANLAYRPDGHVAPPGRLLGGRRRQDAGRRRRRARAPPARRRRRTRTRGHLHGLGMHRVGRRDDRRRLCGAGEHPRLGCDRGGAGVDLRGLRGQPARRAPAGRPRRRGGRRRRPPRPAVGSALVVRKDGGYGGTSDVAADLRVDDHPQPIEELERIYRLHDLLFGQTPEEQWLDVDAALADELRERLAALGYEGELPDALAAWAGTENLEERVSGADRIDPVVLEQLRAQ